jgi:hypothetical protein
MMRSLLTAVPGLGCAVMMVGMMWLMARGNKGDRDRPADRQPSDAGQEAQLNDLRTEIERLRAELRGSDQPAPADRQPGPRPDPETPVAGEGTPGFPHRIQDSR